MERILAVAVIVAWLLGGLYVGVSGWARAEIEQEIEPSSGPSGAVVCGEIEFAKLDDCLQYQRERQFNRLFPWVFYLPSFFGLLMMSFGFGALGGVLRVMKFVVLDLQPLHDCPWASTPLFGGLMGVLVLGTAWVLPAMLTIGGGELRPTTLLFFAMFGGAFSPTIFASIQRQIEKRFAHSESKSEER
jgi:hypothetical protein